MSRYKLKDCDCILAFSGGADCTATLQWLLLKGKKPYIFHYYQKSNYNQYTQDAIKKIKDWYDVPVTNYCVDVQSDNNGFVDRERTKDWHIKSQFWAGKNADSNPMLAKWAATAYWIAFNNPWCQEIYWGYCTGGLLEIGDGKADCVFNEGPDGILKKEDRIDVPMDASNYDDRHKVLFDGFIKNLAHYGIKTQFVAPMAHRTKLDLFKLIPRPVQGMVVACQKTDAPCGVCTKCKELEAVKKACAEEY